MKFIGSSTLLASLALVGCFGSQALEVRITPDGYQVANVETELRARHEAKLQGSHTDQGCPA